MAPHSGKFSNQNIELPQFNGGSTLILSPISHRLAVLSKWAQLIPLPLVAVSAYEFHDFAYAVGELKKLVTSCVNIHNK